MRDRAVRVLAGTMFFLLVLEGTAAAKGAAKIGVIVVDVQADFTLFKNGAMAVDGTDEAYIKAVQENTKKLRAAGLPIYATQDWHPANHTAFFTSHQGKKAFDLIKLRGKDQILWPPHCVQKTPGAEILVDKKLFKAVIKKGKDPQYDSYSGFQDDGGKKTGMEKILKKDGITKLVVYGIATDYWVSATVLDAVAAGYRAVLIQNLCRGVALDTTQKAIEEMKTKGILVLDKMDLERIKKN
jgi:nicotinamidase/pyrazinamidase